MYRGGNLSTGLVLRILDPNTYEEDKMRLPVPCGLFLIYPCLSLDMDCWMKPENLTLMKAESVNGLSTLMQAKEHVVLEAEDSPLSVPEAPRKISILTNQVDRGTGKTEALEKIFGLGNRRASSTHLNTTLASTEDIFLPRSGIRTSLSMTSRMSYFQDRVLQPESKFHFVDE